MYMRPLPGQSSLLTVMIRAAQFAGKSLIRDFEELEHLQVSERGTYKFVQIAEQRAAACLKKDLMKARPHYGFLIEDEEELASQDGEHRWIIDPLDGTNNFGHGLPYFAISIALERNGTFVAGVVYDIIQQRCYFAEKGFGCYVNGRRLRVSGRQHLDKCILSTNFHLTGPIEKRIDLMQRYFQTTLKVAPHISSFRSFGALSLDLAYVAAGKCDGVWLESCHLWDVAAGIVLVREAGGYATTFTGQLIDGDPENIVAANPHIHKELVSLLKE